VVKVVRRDTVGILKHSPASDAAIQGDGREPDDRPPQQQMLAL